ncbi:hypothetical protein AB4Z40_04465 [Bosea sp. 2YAB26]|uniref:hypothetical protein n=1 Tax=Bosea sp. 2YAB26 TaxID=3237478 RepID=UPI003F8DA020
MVKGLSIGGAGLAKAAGFAGLAAMAAVAVNFGWRSLADPIEPPPASAVTKAASITSDALAPPAETPRYQPDMVNARPLFSSSRRPPASFVARAPMPEPVASPVFEPPPSYLIGGVVVSSGLSKALLRRQLREAGRWFALGEATDEGWVVASINPEMVTLARGARQVTLPLHARAQGQPATMTR